jgi:predicted RNA binding protein YcfA (HicA-like mRNA interferase family)
MKGRKVLEQALSGSANIRFNDMISLVEGFGWTQARVKGSHHIFVHPDVRELLNLQNVGGEAVSSSPVS